MYVELNEAYFGFEGGDVNQCVIFSNFTSNPSKDKKQYLYSGVWHRLNKQPKQI